MSAPCSTRCDALNFSGRFQGNGPWSGSPGARAIAGHQPEPLEAGSDTPAGDGIHERKTDSDAQSLLLCKIGSMIKLRLRTRHADLPSDRQRAMKSTSRISRSSLKSSCLKNDSYLASLLPSPTFSPLSAASQKIWSLQNCYGVLLGSESPDPTTAVFTCRHSVQRRGNFQLLNPLQPTKHVHQLVELILYKTGGSDSLPRAAAMILTTTPTFYTIKVWMPIIAHVSNRAAIQT